MNQSSLQKLLWFILHCLPENAASTKIFTLCTYYKIAEKYKAHPASERQNIKLPELASSLV